MIVKRVTGVVSGHRAQLRIAVFRKQLNTRAVLETRVHLQRIRKADALSNNAISTGRTGRKGPE